MLQLDFEKYRYTRSIPAWCVDERHTTMLFNIVMECDFKKILEVGCLDGSTAAAYVEALDRGKHFELHLCDVEIRPALARVIESCKYRERIVLRNEPSWSVIDPTYDFVFVDADHRLEGAGRDVDRLLECDTPTVAAHDINATRAGYEGCEGAQLLGRVYSRLEGYRHCEDCAVRPDELTHRGLFLASRNAQVYEVAAQVFAALT